MKHIVKIFTGIAALVLAVAAISSFASVNFLGIGPVIWSIASINLLLITRAFIGCRSVGAIGDLSESGPGSLQNKAMSRLAQISFFLSVLAFVLAVAGLLTPSPLLGKVPMAWFQGSINLTLIAILACYGAESVHSGLGEATEPHISETREQSTES